MNNITTKVVNSVPFRPEWLKHCIPIQKTEKISFYFKSRSVPDFSAKFRPETFRFHSTCSVPVSFHVFRSALEKPLNQIEPCSISLIKSPDYKKKLFFITIFNSNDINNNIENYYYYFH